MNMNNVIVDTKFVMGKIGKPGWVLVDVRFAEDFGKGHFPGAVGLPAWISKLFADDTKRQATVITRIEQTLGDMGIGSDSHVIVYGDPANVHWNAVLFWILEAGGCNSSRRKGTVQYYDGGVERWQAEGGTLDRQSLLAKPAKFKAAAGVKRGAKIDEILRIVAGKSKAIILDVRMPGEYDGTDVRSLRGGHIPRAINIDFMKNFDLATFRMLPLDQLGDLYKAVPKARRVITHCQTGSRAAYTYLVLRALGYQDLAIYHDGWRVYGSDLKLPVENETWYDFNKINSAINAINKLAAKSA
jgi:thiosulfate/3-mercaptopyruvate sulfurtransferase